MKNLSQDYAMAKHVIKYLFLLLLTIITACQNAESDYHQIFIEDIECVSKENRKWEITLIGDDTLQKHFQHGEICVDWLYLYGKDSCMTVREYEYTLETPPAFSFCYTSCATPIVQEGQLCNNILKKSNENTTHKAKIPLFTDTDSIILRFDTLTHRFQKSLYRNHQWVHTHDVVPKYPLENNDYITVVYQYQADQVKKNYYQNGVICSYTQYTHQNGQIQSLHIFHPHAKWIQTPFDLHYLIGETVLLPDWEIAHQKVFHCMQPSISALPTGKVDIAYDYSYKNTYPDGYILNINHKMIQLRKYRFTLCAK